MKLLAGLFIAGVILVGGGVAFLWLGYYNVAASVSHSKVVAWVLEEVRNRSIKFHSRGVQQPDTGERYLSTPRAELPQGRL